MASSGFEIDIREGNPRGSVKGGEQSVCKELTWYYNEDDLDFDIKDIDVDMAGYLQGLLLCRGIFSPWKDGRWREVHQELLSSSQTSSHP